MLLRCRKVANIWRPVTFEAPRTIASSNSLCSFSRRFANTNRHQTTMKRAAPSSKASPKAKKPRSEVPAYHLAESRRDDEGNIIWPAPKAQIESARSFIIEW
jgi:hypothetical protein